ncbi:cupin domain-containing protein [Roseovarius sp. SYSU LYC5161]|uniref:(R)-mandelonitrile lyase n=1 Tax=Roseovarius halophilus (ex Wu et al. 2025) TaxID=3376060 RepID=UPI00287194C6|nr:cupin domain-containing protein [Roseovarius sp.]
MEIFEAGRRENRLAPPEWFSGRVWQEPVVEAPTPARVRALRVTFEPGARTAWHTHPLGQTLHILSGVGLVGLRGEAPRLIRPGDTVWIPPEQEHWHGAAPDVMMCHLAIQEASEDGHVADWLDHVTEAEYGRQPA